MFSQSGGCKSKVRVSAGLVSPEASPWFAGGCLATVFSHGLFPLQVRPWGLSLFLKGHESCWLRTHPMTSLNLNDLFTGLSPNTVTLGFNI